VDSISQVPIFRIPSKAMAAASHLISVAISKSSGSANPWTCREEETSSWWMT